MRKIDLKRPIQNPVGDRGIMRPGIHHVHDEFLSHWFIKGLVEEGVVILLDEEAQHQSVLQLSGEKKVVEVISNKVLPIEVTPVVEVVEVAKSLNAVQMGKKK